MTLESLSRRPNRLWLKKSKNQNSKELHIKICENPFYLRHPRSIFLKNITSGVVLYLTFFSLLFILSSCSDNKVINEDKFVKVYSDLIIAQDTIPNNSAAFNSVKKKIFARYNITSEDYKNTIEYYNKNYEKWKSFFAKVTAHIEAMKGKKPH